MENKKPVHPKAYFAKGVKTKDVMKELEGGVKGIFESGKYEEYLKTMSKFHRYSLNNGFLIQMQLPNATLCASYTDWQKKFGRQVRKGEKGLTILVPYKKTVTVEDEDGTERKYVKTSFHPGSTFDISQTDGPDLPTICNKLNGDVEGFDVLVGKLREIADVPIRIKDFTGEANGYFARGDDSHICIKANMSQAQTIKTMVHELAHSILHCEDGEEKEADRRTREVQAEGVAFVVNNHLGLDTSEYSFGYIAGWSSGKDIKELKASLEVIRKTSHEIIEGLEGK